MQNQAWGLAVQPMSDTLIMSKQTCLEAWQGAWKMGKDGTNWAFETDLLHSGEVDYAAGWCFEDI